MPLIGAAYTGKDTGVPKKSEEVSTSSLPVIVSITIMTFSSISTLRTNAEPVPFPPGPGVSPRHALPLHDGQQRQIPHFCRASEYTSSHVFMFNNLLPNSSLSQFHSIISIMKLFRNHFQTFFIFYFKMRHSSVCPASSFSERKNRSPGSSHMCLTRSRSSARFASLNRSIVPTK